MVVWSCWPIGRAWACCRDELKAGDAAIQPLQEKTLRGDQVKSVMDKGSPSIRDIDQAPRFKIGDIVTTKSPEITAQVENGHAIATYAALKKGVVIAYYGGHILPDRNAHGIDDAADHLYIALEHMICGMKVMTVIMLLSIVEILFDMSTEQHLAPCLL